MSLNKTLLGLIALLLLFAIFCSINIGMSWDEPQRHWTGAIRTNLRIHNYPGEDPNEMVSADSITSSYIYFMGKDSAEITGQNICLQDA